MGGKTTLTGGAITTTDKAIAEGKNKFSSVGGVETTDIDNVSKYTAKGGQISIGVSASDGLQVSPPGIGNLGKHKVSTTKAGISGYTGAGHSGISTDNKAEYAGEMDNVFDKDKVTQELKMQIEESAKFKANVASIIKKMNAEEEKLRKEARETDDKDTAVQKIKEADKIAKNRRVLNAFGNAMTEITPAGMIVKGMSPIVAYEIGQNAKENKTERTLGHLTKHAVLGAVTTAANGGDAWVGAAAAGLAEGAAPIILSGGKDPKDMTAEEKEQASNKAQVIGAVIGGVTGDVINIEGGQSASKVAVEDNRYMEFDELRRLNNFFDYPNNKLNRNREGQTVIEFFKKDLKNQLPPHEYNRLDEETIKTAIYRAYIANIDSDEFRTDAEHGNASHDEVYMTAKKWLTQKEFKKTLPLMSSQYKFNDNTYGYENLKGSSNEAKALRGAYWQANINSNVHPGKNASDDDIRVYKERESIRGSNSAKNGVIAATLSLGAKAGVNRVTANTTTKTGSGSKGKADHEIADADLPNVYDYGSSSKNMNFNGPDIEVPNSQYISESSVKHIVVGDYNANGRMLNGGHGQDNIRYLEANNIDYNIVRTYPNGVRIGNIPGIKQKPKRTGTNQSWFPSSWDNKQIVSAGESVYLNNTARTGVGPFYGDYKGVRVGIFLDPNTRKISTVFPDANQ